MKNKILIIFLIIILISYASMSFCSYDITINKEVYKFPDEFAKHDYRLFFYVNHASSDRSDLNYFVLSSDYPFSVYASFETGYTLTCSEGYYLIGSSIGTGGYREYDDIYDFSNMDFSFSTSSLGFLHYGHDFLVYSSHDVKDKEGNVVFQGAPLEQVEPMEIRHLEEIQPMTTKLVEAILPVVLAMTGVFLVIYLVRYKIFSHL